MTTPLDLTWRFVVDGDVVQAPTGEPLRISEIEFPGYEWVRFRWQRVTGGPTDLAVQGKDTPVRILHPAPGVDRATRAAIYNLQAGGLDVQVLDA